jgi:hypothetical protein
MALSLAARFPQLIGSTLHQTLAQLPCRPMQCQAMIAQLEDTFKLAEHLDIAEAHELIGKQRYLTDVEACYQQWLNQALPQSIPNLTLTESPKQLTTLPEWQALSQVQQHPWWIDWIKKEKGYQLWAWQTSSNHVTNEIMGVLIKPTHNSAPYNSPWTTQRIRRLKNRLPSSEHLSKIHLWLTALN